MCEGNEREKRCEQSEVDLAWLEPKKGSGTVSWLLFATMSSLHKVFSMARVRLFCPLFPTSVTWGVGDDVSLFPSNFALGALFRFLRLAHSLFGLFLFSFVNRRKGSCLATMISRWTRKITVRMNTMVIHFLSFFFFWLIDQMLYNWPTVPTHRTHQSHSRFLLVFFPSLLYTRHSAIAIILTRCQCRRPRHQHRFSGSSTPWPSSISQTTTRQLYSGSVQSCSHILKKRVLYYNLPKWITCHWNPVKFPSGGE